TQALMDAPTRSDDQCVQEFVRTRAVNRSDIYRAEVATHIAGFNMVKRNLNTGTGAGHYLGCRHNGFRTRQLGTHGPATGFMPDRAMFELAVHAHNRALSVGFDLVSAAHCI